MRHDQGYYDNLRAQWEVEKEALHNARRELDKARQKFFDEYYLTKNGSTDQEGSRPKQNRERAAERKIIDEEIHNERQKYDDAHESWQAHLLSVGSLRKNYDEKDALEYKKQLDTLEKRWQEYQTSLQKYNNDYYPNNNKDRAASDKAAMQNKRSADQNRIDALHNSIEQDEVMASFVINEAELQSDNAANRLKLDNANAKQLLHEQRQIDKSKRNEANNTYYSNMRAERAKNNAALKEVRATNTQFIQKLRHERDQYYAEHHGLRQYWHNSKFIQDLSRNLISFAVCANYLRDLGTRSRQALATLTTNNSAIFNSISVTYKSMSKGLDEMMFGINKTTAEANVTPQIITPETTPKPIITHLPVEPEQTAHIITSNANIAADQTAHIITPSTNVAEDQSAHIVASSTEASTVKNPDHIITDSQSETKQSSLTAPLQATAQNIASLQAAAQNIESLQAAAQNIESLQAAAQNIESAEDKRAAAYAAYDSYIRNFFASRIKARATAIEEKNKSRHAKDNQRIIQRNTALLERRTSRNRYDTGISNIRKIIYNNYANDIRILKGNNYPRLARNKSIALSIRTAWHKTLDLGLGLVRGIYTSGSSIKYNSRTLAIKTGRSIFDAFSWSIYVLGSGTYIFHLIDRYILWPLEFFLLDIAWYFSKAVNIILDNLYKFGVFVARNISRAADFVFNVIILRLVKNIADVLGRIVNKVFNITWKALKYTGYGISKSLLILAIIPAYTMAGIFAAASYTIYFPVRFGVELTLAAANYLISNVVIGTFNTITTILDVSIHLGYSLYSNALLPVARVGFDIARNAWHIAESTAIVTQRFVLDRAHDTKVALWDNFGLRIGQAFNDVINSAKYNVNRAATAVKFRGAIIAFKAFVGARSLFAKAKYALGFTFGNASFYSGRLVTKVSRVASDRVHDAAVQIEKVAIPAGKIIQKDGVKIVHGISEGAIKAARVADDYIRYPITYVAERGTTKVSRALHDGSVTAYRTTQDACTEGIRAAHDISFEVHKKLDPKVITFSRNIHDTAVEIEHKATWAALKGYDSLQNLNIAEALERDAEKVLKEIKTKEAAQQDPESQRPSEDNPNPNVEHQETGPEAPESTQNKNKLG
jgi:hypothetical protein